MTPFSLLIFFTNQTSWLGSRTVFGTVELAGRRLQCSRLGYNCASIAQLLLQWGKRSEPLLFRGDSHRLVPRSGFAADPVTSDDGLCIRHFLFADLFDFLPSLREDVELWSDFLVSSKDESLVAIGIP